MCSSDLRRYSQISARTLQRLDSLETTYDEMAAAVSEIKLALDAGVSREDLLSVKHRLAQLNGDLEKFQFTKIDAVETSELNSGKTDAKAHRKVVRPHPHLLPSPPRLAPSLRSHARVIARLHAAPPARRR